MRIRECSTALSPLAALGSALGSALAAAFAAGAFEAGAFESGALAVASAGLRPKRAAAALEALPSAGLGAGRPKRAAAALAALAFGCLDGSLALLVSEAEPPPPPPAASPPPPAPPALLPPAPATADHLESSCDCVASEKLERRALPERSCAAFTSMTLYRSSAAHA